MVSATDTVYPRPKSWQQFEVLSARLFTERHGSTFKRYGNGRQQQFGVDIIGRVRGKIIGVQCKGRHSALEAKLSEKQIRKEVDEAKQFSPKLHRYFILTSGNDDAEYDRLAIEISRENEDAGFFPIEIWGWQHIEQEIGQAPKIYQSYYKIFGHRFSPVAIIAFY